MRKLDKQPGYLKRILIAAANTNCSSNSQIKQGKPIATVFTPKHQLQLNDVKYDVFNTNQTDEDNVKKAPEKYDKATHSITRQLTCKIWSSQSKNYCSYNINILNRYCSIPKTKIPGRIRNLLLMQCTSSIERELGEDPIQLQEMSRQPEKLKQQNY